MIGKPFNQVGKTDIDSLVTAGTPEGRTLEYKEQLPEKGDADKEFLKDVSSLANTGGGDIVYGVRERRDGGKATGVPELACGIPNLNADQEILRLQNLLRDATDPPLTRVQMKQVVGFELGPVLLIRVRRSSLAPHMVTYHGHLVYYGRNNNATYRMGSAELRAAFLTSATLVDRIGEFRMDRIARIANGQTPVPLVPGPAAVVQLLPFEAFDPLARRDLTAAAARCSALPPVGGGGPHTRFTFDGFLSTMRYPDNRNYHGYRLAFRHGMLERVDPTIAKLGSRDLSGHSLTKELVSESWEQLRIADEMGLAPPYALLLTLLGVHGVSLTHPSYRDDDIGVPIDRDQLLLPEVTLEETPTEREQLRDLLAPSLDALWQAAGFPSCPVR